MTYLKAVKIMIPILLGYPLLFAEAFGGIPALLTASYLVLDALYIWKTFSVKGGKIKLPKEAWIYVLFFLYSVVTGLAVANNTSYFLEHVFMGVQYLVLFLAVYDLCIYEGNAKYISIVLYVLAAAYLLISLQRGIKIFGRLVISSSSNANTLGLMCFFCAGLGIYLGQFMKKKFILPAISVLLSLYVAVLSGSRKYLLIILAFSIIYFCIQARAGLRKHLGTVVLVCVFLCVSIVIAWPYIDAFFKSSIISARFDNAESIDGGRWGLYNDAINVFKEHPIFGVGYQCFQFYSPSGLYAHSAYAEILSCTGFLGFVLWLLFYPILLKRLVQNLRRSHFDGELVFAFVWLACQIVLDFFSIAIYNPGNFAMLGAILAISYSSKPCKQQHPTVERGYKLCH